MYDSVLRVPVVGVEVEPFVAALARGASGAAVGTLPAFVFTGFVVVPAGELATGIPGVIGFGAFGGDPTRSSGRPSGRDHPYRVVGPSGIEPPGRAWT